MTAISAPLARHLNLDAMTVRGDAQINRCNEIVKGYPVHQIADWAGTSERMMIDVYRHKQGRPIVSPLESGTWSPRDR